MISGPSPEPLIPPWDVAKLSWLAPGSHFEAIEVRELITQVVRMRSREPGGHFQRPQGYFEIPPVVYNVSLWKFSLKDLQILLWHSPCSRSWGMERPWSLSLAIANKGRLFQCKRHGRILLYVRLSCNWLPPRTAAEARIHWCCNVLEIEGRHCSGESS